MMDGGHYHLIGVAGVGMSALAQALLAAGCEVSGSDRYVDGGGGSDVIRKLCGAGVRMFSQDGSGLSFDTRSVVISTAIESDNPDLLRAGELGVGVMHRSEALAALLEGKSCIAVTGTSGKSTVTGMIGWVLECLGADPSVVNGAPVVNWRDEAHIGNMRKASAAGLPSSGRCAGLWVVEADESDRSLLNLHPDWAVITNVSKDHFSVEETMELFARFRAQAAIGVVSMIDEQQLLQDFRPELTRSGSRFGYEGVDFSLVVSGRHNAENALCAVIVCERLGYNLKAVSEALGAFKGIERRLERVGDAGGVPVVDDYAHNPAKIRASWQAMASYCVKLHAVWRPHGFGPLRTLMDELVSMFSEVTRPADRLFILPVYDAGGTANRSVNSDVLVEKLKQRGVAAVFAEDTDGLPEMLASGVESGDAVLTMGARDPDLPALAKRILAELRKRGA